MTETAEVWERRYNELRAHSRNWERRAKNSHEQIIELEAKNAELAKITADGESPHLIANKALRRELEAKQNENDRLRAALAAYIGGPRTGRPHRKTTKENH